MCILVQCARSRLVASVQRADEVTLSAQVKQKLDVIVADETPRIQALVSDGGQKLHVPSTFNAVHWIGGNRL